MENNQIPKNQLGSINILRFLAALSVLMYHYTFMFYTRGVTYLDFPVLREVFRYGYLGVPLFFIISGFVITLSAEGKNFKDFFISRVVRLYPMLWLAATLTFLFFLLFGKYHYAFNHIGLLTYIMNLTMIPTLFNYPLIDGSYWTLAVELKFYAFIGILLIFGLFKYICKILPGLIFLLIVSIVLGQPYNSVSYFLSGIVFYDIYKNSFSKTKGLMACLLYTISIYYQTLLITIQNIEQETKTDLLSVGLYITLFYVAFFAISLRKWSPKNSRLITVLGGLTYPIYLLHQEIGAILFGMQDTLYSKYIALTLTLFLIMSFAYILYMYIERPTQGVLKKALTKVLSK